MTSILELGLKGLTHYYISCGRRGKLEFVDTFLTEYAKRFLDGSVLVFVNSWAFAERFCKSLIDKGHKSEILTSDMSHDDWLAIMSDFWAGKLRILVTTNLLAWGIDNRKIGLVLNLDMPYLYESNSAWNFDSETYIHRVGRTGWFGDRGVAVNIAENEQDIASLKKVQADYGINLVEITLENFV